MAKQLWLPQTLPPVARQKEEDTWFVTTTCQTGDKSQITFKVGSKKYALDNSVQEGSNKMSELFLARKYR